MADETQRRWRWWQAPPFRREDTIVFADGKMPTAAQRNAMQELREAIMARQVAALALGTTRHRGRIDPVQLSTAAIWGLCMDESRGFWWGPSDDRAKIGFGRLRPPGAFAFLELYPAAYRGDDAENLLQAIDNELTMGHGPWRRRPAVCQSCGTLTLEWSIHCPYEGSGLGCLGARGDVVVARTDCDWKWCYETLCLKCRRQAMGDRKSRARGITKSRRYDILNRDGFRCKVCGRGSESGIKLHVDHIWPVSKGGGKEDWNLQTLCNECNSGKSNKEPETHETANAL